MTLSYSNLSNAFPTLFQTEKSLSASDGVTGHHALLFDCCSDMAGFLAILARGIAGLAAKKRREVSGV